MIAWDESVCMIVGPDRSNSTAYLYTLVSSYESFLTHMQINTHTPILLLVNLWARLHEHVRGGSLLDSVGERLRNRGRRLLYCQASAVRWAGCCHISRVGLVPWPSVLTLLPCGPAPLPPVTQAVITNTEPTETNMRIWETLISVPTSVLIPGLQSFLGECPWSPWRSNCKYLGQLNPECVQEVVVSFIVSVRLPIMDCTMKQLLWGQSTRNTYS